MARKNVPAEFNTFVKGLITEASPLTFPDNASLEEVNMVLNRDGSRQRRLGFDVNTDEVEITTTFTHSSSVRLAHSTFKWTNAGGNPDKSLLVVQIGDEIRIFDLDSDPLSDGLLFTKIMSTSSDDISYSYAVVDGILLIASNSVTIFNFEFDGTSTVTEGGYRLKIRDLFGVEDSLNDGNTNDFAIRPTTLDDEHLYNIRNQTFALPRYDGGNEITKDPITSFFDTSIAEYTTKRYPAHTDNLLSALYPDAGDAGNRTVDRFFASDLMVNQLGTTLAPKGFFIIDALSRGDSRLNAEGDLLSDNSILTHNVTALPADITPGGSTVVSEFAGRAFYAGFSGTVTDGDIKSPRMSSYILFSQLVDNTNDLNKCYQEGDPTNPESPDLIATDGGFIRLDEAYGIQSMHNLGSSLLIVASNGVWRLFGGNEEGFSATNFVVERVTDHGSLGVGTVVRIDNSIMYWGDDGIYTIQQDQFGAWRATNLSIDTIQSFYEGIDPDDKAFCRGFYDSFQRRVKWLFDNDTNNANESRELVFDVRLRAFYTNEIRVLGMAAVPRAVDVFEDLPFNVALNQFDVFASGDDVVIGTDDVVVSIGARQSSAREIAYLIITDITTVVKFSFGSYNNSNFLDWESIDSVGVDADGFMLSGYLSGGDFQRYKQITYLTTHFRRTETGFVDDGSGNITARPESSCLIQSQWEWANSVTSGRWGREFQAYRLKKHFIPNDVSAPFDYGFTTVVTRNKLRGKGKVVSLQFKTEPGKDLHIYGWSVVMGINGNV